MGHRLVVQPKILAVRLKQDIIERKELPVVGDGLSGLQRDVLREHFIVDLTEF